MIPEPTHSGGQAIQRRNNNLLCVAIVLFVIGIGTIEGVMALTPFWIGYFDIDVATLLAIAMIVGVLPTLGGIYVMWRWWQSGS